MGGRLKPYIEKELDNYIEKNCQDMESYHYKISDDSETFTLVAKMYIIDPDNVFDRVKIIGQIVNAQYFNLARVGGMHGYHYFMYKFNK
jgi:hypothetical protein